MATIEGSTSHTDAPSVPLTAMVGRSVRAASATATMTMTEVPIDLSNTTGEVLRLTLRARPTVRWDENVEDNEGMGRKSSKRCCIFHKQREFGESSTDSSADENENSDDGNSDSDDKKPRATNHQRRKIARPKKKDNDVPDYQRFHA